MKFFSKKEPYQYKILEKYKIDIEKTNQTFLYSSNATDNWRGREFCELVAGNKDYLFYAYRTYSDGNGGYILRQDKIKPKNVVFLVKIKSLTAFFTIISSKLITVAS